MNFDTIDIIDSKYNWHKALMVMTIKMFEACLLKKKKVYYIVTKIHKGLDVKLKTWVFQKISEISGAFYITLR